MGTAGFISVLIFFSAITLGIILVSEAKPKIKRLLVSLVLVIAIILISQKLYSNRTPKITILEPKNEIAIQSKAVIIKGKVKPEISNIDINGIVVKVTNGEFNGSFDLPEENNNFKVTATNKNKSDYVNLKVKRIYTAEEIAEINRIKEEADSLKKAEDEKLRKEQEVWDKTKAGKICDKHFGWTKEDCEKVADGKIWIGMDIWMVVEERGNPNGGNVSNYGNGDEHQYCWYRYEPSCFYDNNGDNKVDAYN